MNLTMRCDMVRYEVKGSKDNVYTVIDDNGHWTCTCPHYTYRNVECKHIKQVKEGHKVV